MTNTCLECNKKLVGRTDKKYCDDHCRNAFNNRKNRDHLNLIRNTNNKLRKNWRILERLNTTEQTTITKQKLIDKGFDFSYFTSLYISKTGKHYFFVYNQGYLAIKNDSFVLTKKEFSP